MEKQNINKLKKINNQIVIEKKCLNINVNLNSMIHKDLKINLTWKFSKDEINESGKKFDFKIEVNSELKGKTNQTIILLNKSDFNDLKYKLHDISLIDKTFEEILKQQVKVYFIDSLCWMRDILKDMNFPIYYQPIENLIVTFGMNQQETFFKPEQLGQLFYELKEFLK